METVSERCLLAMGAVRDVDMDMGVQIVFLDGEEAFEVWSDSDSLYGARYVDLCLQGLDRLFCRYLKPQIGRDGVS